MGGGGGSIHYGITDNTIRMMTFLFNWMWGGGGQYIMV